MKKHIHKNITNQVVAFAFKSTFASLSSLSSHGKFNFLFIFNICFAYQKQSSSSSSIFFALFCLLKKIFCFLEKTATIMIIIIIKKNQNKHHHHFRQYHEQNLLLTKLSWFCGEILFKFQNQKQTNKGEETEKKKRKKN